MGNHWQALAQTALRALWGEKVRCSITDTLREGGRNLAYRLQLSHAPVSSLVLKASVGDTDNPYRVGDNRPWSAFSRFCNEWAGCDMLAPLGLGPKAYAGNLEHGFFLMEDLGDGQSLADRLTGHDPASTTAALFAYARSLGELHAATQGQQTRWLRLHATVSQQLPQPVGLDHWQDISAKLAAMLKRHGLTLPASFEPEIARVRQTLEQPGAYLAFSPTDCCPDNHYLRGDRVVFFDCEGATMRHALLDVTYLLAPFPTCWCTSRLPQALLPPLIAAYREHFPGGEDFEQQLTLVLTSWVLSSLTWDWAGNWEEQDHTWGLVTLRQRHLHRLENLLAQQNLQTVLPGLAEITQQLHYALKQCWLDLEPMPLYPAFAHPE